MYRARLLAILVIVQSGGILSAQDGPQKGQIKKLDVNKSTIVVASDGKDISLRVTDETRVIRADGEQVDNLFKEKTFAIGATVFFKADGDTLKGIKLLPPGVGKGP